MMSKILRKTALYHFRAKCQMVQGLGQIARIRLGLTWTRRIRSKMNGLILNTILLFALIASPPTLCNDKETDPIVLICRKVTDFGFCVYTLRSDPHIARATVDGLAHKTIDLLGSHAKDTLNYLQNIQKYTPGEMKMFVGTCVKFYGVATNRDIPSAARFLNGKAYENAAKAASAVMVDGQRCQEVVEKNPSPIWQRLIGRNYYTRDLSQLGRDLIGLLKK